MMAWVNSLCHHETSKLYSLSLWLCTVAAKAAGLLTETQGNICSIGWVVVVQKCLMMFPQMSSACSWPCSCTRDAYSELHEGINERSCRVSEPWPTCVSTGMQEKFPNKVKSWEVTSWEWPVGFCYCLYEHNISVQIECRYKCTPLDIHLSPDFSYIHMWWIVQVGMGKVFLKSEFCAVKSWNKIIGVFKF